MVDGFRGKPEFSEKDCVGCGACAEVCVGHAIRMIDPENPKQNGNRLYRTMEVRYDMCNFCGNCEAHCITEKGIHLTKEFDLAITDRKLARESIQKELVTCELCGDILSTKDHLKWLTQKLGTLAYGNPTLILTSQRELMPVQSGVPGEELRRPDLMKVLCPHCRHEVVLKDIWG